MNPDSKITDSKPRDAALNKRRTGDALIYLAAAGGLTVIGILVEILRRLAVTDFLADNSMDLLSPFMMIVGIFLSIVGLVKLVRADQASRIP